MSTQEPDQPSEEELRAAWEEQMRNISVGDVLIQTAVTLVNLAGRRLGLGAGGEAERDLAQVRDAVDSVRGLLPILEREGAAQELKPLRDALSQLQLEYAKLAQGPPVSPGQPAGETATGAPEPAAAGDEPAAEGPGPAQSSGRLWVPGS